MTSTASFVERYAATLFTSAASGETRSMTSIRIPPTPPSCLSRQVIATGSRGRGSGSAPIPVRGGSQRDRTDRQRSWTRRCLPGPTRPGAGSGAKARCSTKCTSAPSRLKARGGPPRHGSRSSRADFPGEFGWGYDGVALYAPAHQYGTPDDLRAFVDRAHALGLGVILDVVYNHLGPDGNFLAEFSPEYFTDKYENDWGQAITFEGPSAARELFVANAAYWVDEFHVDGLRLDATQDMHDGSREHVLAELARKSRAAAPHRSLYIVAENEPQHSALVREPAEGGYGLDALWNDDFHHAAVVAMTGRREAYYQDYKGSPQELISCAKYGFLYQGQYYPWQKKRRGTASLDLPAAAFVAYLENHDQVANSAHGKRLHQVTSPGRFRALTALLLLGPATPMLFQGQEFNATSPFLYFADQKRELHEAISSGRREFLAQFSSLRDRETVRRLPSPVDRATFERSRLEWTEREKHAEAVALHADLIALRKGDPVISLPGRRIDGAVVAPDVLALRYLGGEAGDRLLILNLGCDLDLSAAPEPLLAPPSGGEWQLIWSSEAAVYGGQGTAAVDLDREWHLMGEAALLFRASRKAHR